MGARGRKRKYENAEAVGYAIGEYFGKCEREEVFPDYAGMLLFLNISKSCVQEWTREDHDEYMEYRRIFEEAAMRRTSWLERRMVTEPKAANGCMNSLKQKCNGGFVDRPKDEGGGTSLTINLIGLGGADQFKG